MIIVDGTIIGGANLECCLEESTYEIGWTIHPNYRNHGYATEAANALVQYAFNDLIAKKFMHIAIAEILHLKK